MTSLELREKGYQVLVDNLGEVAAIQFLQDFGWGHGDYTKERETTLKGVTRETFWQDINRLRATKNQS
jgi:hypothetical protein